MTTQTVETTPASPPFSLIWIIETLLFVNLREDLVSDTDGDPSDGAYRYGL